MALRLRRGTDAERLLITPLEGELIYTTDTKKVYVGDGSTPGGVAVDTNTQLDFLNQLSQASINDLSDVNADSSMPNNGDLLTYDSATGDWRAAPIDPTLAITAGESYNIGILGDDSTQIIDPTRKLVTADLNGDLYDSSNNKLFDPDVGIFYAKDGSSIIDLNLKGIQADLRGNVQGSVLSDDLAVIMVDNINVEFNGTLVGDVKGSVFLDDSTTAIVDGINGNVNPTEMVINFEYKLEYDGPTNSLRITPETDNSTPTKLSIGSRDSQSTLDIERLGPLAAPGDIIGDVRFSEDGQYVSIIQARRSNLYTTVGFSNNNGITQYDDRVIVGGLGYRIDPSNANFGATDSALDIEGVMKLAPQIAAPSTPVDGMIASADGVNWDPAGKSGVVSYPVYFDGSSWNALY